MQTFDFVPADTLFCRDGRPLAAGSSFGRGANWPLPTVLHSAVRTALLRSANCLPNGKHQGGALRNGLPKGRVGTTAFQWLHVHGPFPVSKSNGAELTWFPIPRDLVASDSTNDGPLEYLRVIAHVAEQNNLPVPLTHVPASFAPPSKRDLSGWVTMEYYKDYLRGELLPTAEKPVLWDNDHRIGAALEDETHIAAPAQLYAAEHLRLRDGVRLRFEVADRPRHKYSNEAENEKDIANLLRQILQLGGERRFGEIVEAAAPLELPKADVKGVHIKWVLLTPAVFSYGWRPGWVTGDGCVKLRVVDRESRRNLRRQRRNAGWRYCESHDTAPKIDARLVAACLGKPQTIGGWDLLHEDCGKVTGGDKPSYLAVPSGSVFYFRAATEAEGAKLAMALQGRCRSDFFGEKGLGLGACGTWQKQEGHPQTST